MTDQQVKSDQSHSALKPDERIDLETLRFIRDNEVPEWVPTQRLVGLVRRGLALGHTGTYSLSAAGKHLLARLAERAR